MNDPNQKRDAQLAALLEEAQAELHSSGIAFASTEQARQLGAAGELGNLLAMVRQLDAAAEDWELEETYSAIAPETGDPQADVTIDQPEPLPERIGRYRILSKLGEGGMGTVYKAEDTQLRRIVALKLPHFTGSKRDRVGRIKRFEREARAVAAIRHQHVCAIHDVGEQDELPYVVMAYLEGETLAQRLRGGRRFDDFHQAAALIRQLADALQAVHAGGIIHRDLKPGNVMIDPVGRAILMDFGLATPEENGDHLTLEGTILGTPAYMAPEQAAGRLREIGPATDLYALGAILYEMLTGQPPFRGETAPAVLDQIRSRPVVPPSRVVKFVPRDLETICLKCLEKDPAKRYEAARGLAEDLDLFLRHVPIRARRSSLLERFVGWCRREPKVAALLAACVLVFAVGLTVASSLWWRGRQQETAHFEEALTEVEHGLQVVGREEFTLQPQTDLVRREYLEELRRKCQRLLQERTDHPALRRKVAEVQQRLGTIYQLLGKYEDAERAYRAAIDLRTQVVAEKDHAVEDVDRLGQSYYDLGNLLATIGRLDEAEHHFQQAVERQSSNADSTTDLAATHHRLGNLQALTGRLEDGEKSLRHAVRLQNEVVAQQPGAVNYQVALAQYEMSLAELLVPQSRFNEAEELYRAAVDRQQPSSPSDPGPPLQRLGLGRTLALRARMFENLDRYQEARDDWMRAYEILKKLGEDHPHRPDYRLELTHVFHNIARFVNDGGPSVPQFKDNEALVKSYRDAVDEQERLVKEFPAVVEYQRQLALSQNTLATWLNDGYLDAHGVYHIELVHEAEGLHRRSEAIWRKLVAQHPTALPYLHGLCVSHQRYGLALVRLNRLDEAEERYREALGMLEKLTAQYPQVARHWLARAALNECLAAVFERRHDLPEAERHLRQAITLIRRALEINPMLPPARHVHIYSLRDLALNLVQQGRHREAAPLAPEWEKGWRHVYYSYHELLDPLYRCAQLAEVDFTLTAEERRKLQATYADWSMDLVRLMMAKCPEASYLSPWVEFLDHLRGREDFQKLYREAREREKKQGAVLPTRHDPRDSQRLAPWLWSREDAPHGRLTSSL